MGNAIAVRSFDCWDVVVVVVVVVVFVVVVVVEVVVVVFCDRVRRGYPITFRCLKNGLLIFGIKRSNYLLVDGQAIV